VIFRHYNELERTSDTAVFFGCGPSINDITQDDWKVLKKYDVWAVNFFLYHDFIIPDFYYRGCGKHGTPDENYKKFKNLWNKKKKTSYKNTKFIIPERSRNCVSTITDDEVYLIRLYYSWKKSWFRRQKKSSNPVNYEYDVHKIALEEFEIMDDAIYFYGRASTCFLLVLMYQMGYEEIIIYGNDLNTKTYFWSDRPREQIHWQWAKQSKPGERGSKEGNHPNIISVTTFVPWFNENYMNNRMFVGSKKTLLHPKVPYKSIEELR